MAEFPQVLSALMKLEDITQAELERASGIDRTTISRFQRGERIPDRDQLGRLLVGISGDRSRQIELLFAHLRDEADAARAAGITPSHYVIKSADEDAPGLAGTLSAEMDLIRDEAVQHDDVRDVVVDLAAMIRRHRAELCDSRGHVYPFIGDSAAAVAEGASPAPSGNLGQAVADEHAHIGQAFRTAQTPSPVPPPTPTPPAPPPAAPATGDSKAGE